MKLLNLIFELTEYSNLNYSEIENMIIWQRDVYALQINKKIKEENDKWKN